MVMKKPNTKSFYKLRKKTEEDPLQYIKELQEIGVGEIILTNIDREGCRVGLDTNFIKFISNNVAIPISKWRGRFFGGFCFAF